MPPYRLTQSVTATEREITFSMAGVKFYLVGEVGPQDTEFEVRARLQLEDEIPMWVRSGWDFAGNHQSGPTAGFLRGQEGTTAAAHEAGHLHLARPADVSQNAGRGDSSSLTFTGNYRRVDAHRVAATVQRHPRLIH
jgi:hypothetical protein